MKRVPTLLAALLLLAFALLCATSLVRKSGTYDEYLVGLGTRLSSPEAIFHPPLSSVLHSLPFLWLTIPDEIWAEPHGQLRGQKVVALRSDDWMLDAARLALLVTGLGLGALVYVWSRRLYGAAGGLFALALYAFDPNVIAHARLITPDTTLACTAVLFAYRLWRLAEEPGWRCRALAGLALGLMLLSKYTALLLLGILLLTDVVYRLRSGRASLRDRRSWTPVAGDWLAVTGLGALVLWAGYGFDTGRIALASGLELPVVAPRYVEGVLFQWEQSRAPHGFFLMGRHSTGGWWYFYLVVLLVKLPLATLALILARALAGRRLGMRWRVEETYLWLPPLLLLLYLSSFNTIHNGLRYLLPFYPLLLVSLGAYAIPALRSRAFRALLCVPLAWLVAASLWIWPDYLAYCNELIGGPRNGYRVLSDSNLDWGQDLPQLAEWMRRHDVPRIQLAYFGTADPAHYGIDYVYLPSANSTLRPTPPLEAGETPPRIVALSAYQYQGVGFGDPRAYAFFHRYRPNDLVGYSILIFDLDDLRPR